MLQRRLWCAGSIFFIGMSIAGLRFVQLQAIQRQVWRQQAIAQQRRLLSQPVFRRSIVDRRSVARHEAEFLAIDRPTYTLWARPEQYKQAETGEILAEIVAPIVDRPRAELRQIFTAEWPSIAARDLSEAQTHRLRQAINAAQRDRHLDLSGFDLQPSRQRVYPHGEVAAAVVGHIGFTGAAGEVEPQGLAGIELKWQEQIDFDPPAAVEVWQDGLGAVQAASHSANGNLQVDEQVVQLTLDMRLQRAAQAALRKGMAEYEAERGAAIVMNPHTGEILALVDEPTYDSNHYYDYDISRYRNWAVAERYEPGSTFKPISVALALQANAIQPGTLVEDTGLMAVGGHTIQNYDYNPAAIPGWLDISQVLQRSSNVGTVRILDLLGREPFYEGLLSLGLGQPSGVDFPLEPSSYIKDRFPTVNYPIEAATAAFGQGIAVTPLQLVQLHAAIANGGYRVTPHVMRGLVDRDTDELMWQPERPQPERVLSAEVTAAVRQMLLDVVERGSGSNVAIEGYQIGGKTGTAQKSDGSGYLPRSQRITSFIAYFPALEPQYVILAVTDNPQGDSAFGGTVTAPIVRSIIEEIIANDILHPQRQATELPSRDE